MVCMASSDSQGALRGFEAALEEARRVDASGPREAEVLSAMALFFEQEGRVSEAEECKAKAGKIFKKFEEAR
jgi:Flp pilus assembly protein TadD